MIVGSPTKLNLIPSGVMPVVYINQGDAGYDKEFLIYNGDSPYNVPSGVSATIRGTKADGYGVTEAAALTTGSNLVTVTITEQMVAASGANLYELVFVDTDGLRIATINMVWAVKKDALGDSVISDSDLDYATTVMNQLQSVQAFKSQMDSNTNRIGEVENGLAAETEARIAADNGLQVSINSETNTRASADATLQSQINQIVAPTGAAPSAAEIENARVGVDGVTYTSLGDAIRAQINGVEYDISDEFESVVVSGLVEKPNGINYFDKYSDNINVGYWNTSNGTINSSSIMRCVKVKVSTTGTYSLLGATTYLSESEVIKIPVFNIIDGSYLGTKYGSLDRQSGIVTVSGMNTVTVNPECYLGYSYRFEDADKSFVTDGPVTTAPNFKYILNKRLELPETAETRFQELSEMITDSYKAITTSGLIQRPNGINLFDQNSEDIEEGRFYNPDGSDGTNSTMGRILIEVPTVGTYSLLGATSFYGASNVIRIPIFKVSDNTFAGIKYGTLNTANNIVTIRDLNTIVAYEDTCYIGYSFKLQNKSAAFVTDKEETDIPEFIYRLDPQITVDGIENPLIGKTGVFLGDSICAGQTVPASETDYYGWGWAGRIGNNNLMSWYNLGINGASITRMTGRSCIQDELATAIQSHPTADYIIIEGGTNDADVISGSSEYSIGTFVPADYESTYDATTFCGAFETLIRNAINAYPTKKIGYIIPQKMGQFAESLNRRRELFDVAKQICEKWGVVFIDIWGSTVLNPKISAYYDSSQTPEQNIANGKPYVDGQHLTDVGYDMITPSIEAWMKNMK